MGEDPGGGDRVDARGLGEAGGSQRPGYLGLAGVLALVVTLVGCGGSGRSSDAATSELMVFAAASLRDVVDDLRTGFEARSGVGLTFNFAGSKVLALQIEASPGAADVFLSADQLWIDHLDRAGLLREGSRVEFLSNRLVVVAARSSPLRISEMSDLASPGVRFVAIGHPEAVPAGRYARAALERVPMDGGSLWQAVEPRIAPAADVRAALTLVEARDDTVGIVYATDASTAARARVELEVPAAYAPPIGYFAAVTRATRHAEAASELVRYLGGDEARVIFERHGFDLPVVPSG